MWITKLKISTVVLLIVGVAVMGDERKPREPAKDAAKEQPKGAGNVGGTLKELDTAKNSLTITTANRSTGKVDKSYEIAKDVAVLRDGKPSKLSDLKTGINVNAALSADQKSVVSISVNGKTVGSPLKSIDAEANTVTVTVTEMNRGQPGAKKDITYTLEKDGKVLLEGKEVKLADLKDVRPGSTIQLSFSVDDEKKLIKVSYAPARR